MTNKIDNDADKEPSGKAKGGKAKAAKMTPEERKEAAKKMAAAKKELASLPIAEYGSSDAPYALVMLRYNVMYLAMALVFFLKGEYFQAWVCLQVLLTDYLIL